MDKCRRFTRKKATINKQKNNTNPQQYENTSTRKTKRTTRQIISTVSGEESEKKLQTKQSNNTIKQPLRRSHRIQNHNAATTETTGITAANYFQNLIDKSKPEETTNKNIFDFSQTSKLTNTSSELSPTPTFNLFQPRSVNIFNNTIESPQKNFTDLLKQQLGTFKIPNMMELYVEKVKREVESINLVLSGEEEPMSPDDVNYNRCSSESDIGDDIVELLSPSKWIYKTPKMQRVVVPDTIKPNNQLEPAIMQTTNKNKCLFEVNDEAKKLFNFNSIIDKENIAINTNYMKNICNVPLGESNYQFVSNDVTMATNDLDITVDCASQKLTWKSRSPQPSTSASPYFLYTKRPMKSTEFSDFNKINNKERGIFGNSADFLSSETLDQFNYCFANLDEAECSSTSD